jgi:acyl carrier protein
MDAFPLTINGKINRKVLPMPEINISGNREYIAPHNQTEQTLEKIWMEVLGIPRVSVGDSFFDIGGNSLSALQVVARIRDAFEIAVPVRRIFAFPGLSDLAAQIDLELLYQKQNSGLQDEINDFEEFIL